MKDELIKKNKLFAEYLGYVYIPSNKVKNGEKPGWHYTNKIYKGIIPSYLGRNHINLPFYRDWNTFLRVLEKANRNKHVTIYKNEIYRHILDNDLKSAADFLYANILYEKIK